MLQLNESETMNRNESTHESMSNATIISVELRREVLPNNTNPVEFKRLGSLHTTVHNNATIN